MEVWELTKKANKYHINVNRKNIFIIIGLQNSDIA